MSNVSTNNQLPTLAELYDDSIEAMGKLEGLNAILNSQPRSEWIKEHPYIEGWLYIPIDKIEYMLSKLFKNYSISVLKTGMLMNSVEVTVRVSYFNPALNEMSFHDGVGACELQTVAKTGALKPDMSNVARGAISMALPIAKTLAIKDATDHIGRIFGRDLNRKDIIPFTPDNVIAEKYSKAQTLIDEIKQLIGEKGPFMTEQALAAAERIIQGEETNSYEKLKKHLIEIEIPKSVVEPETKTKRRR